MEEDDRSGYEAGSEASSSSLRSELSLSALFPKKEKKKKKRKVKKKSDKPCEVCGGVENDLLMMICFKCRDTREHTYCANVLLPRVPPMWLCEECRGFPPDPTAQFSRIILVDRLVNKVSNEETAPSSRADQVLNNGTSIEATPSSRTNQVVEQVVPHIHQYTAGESTPESSYLVSPSPQCSKPLWEKVFIPSLSSDSKSSD